MVYNSMDSRVTSWSGCLLFLGRRLVVFFSPAAESSLWLNGTMEWNLSLKYLSPKMVWVWIPCLLLKNKHHFSIYFGLRDKFPPIRLQIRMRWLCFGHFIENKSNRHSQGQLRIFSRFPTAGVATTTSDAFGWWSPVNTVATWTETPDTQVHVFNRETSGHIDASLKEGRLKLWWTIYYRNVFSFPNC